MTSPPPNSPPPGAKPEAYQHWMDDAANMGLMLFRMRNDSKREGIVERQRQSSGTPPGTPPPVLSPQGRRVGTSPPPPLFSPKGQQMRPRQSSSSPIPIPPGPPIPHSQLSAFQPFPSNQSHLPQNVTPRTGLALQTPTVATSSSGNSRHTESTVSSTHDQAPDIPGTFYRESSNTPHRHSSRRSHQPLD